MCTLLSRNEGVNHDWWVRFQDFEVLEAFHLFNHHGNPRVSDFDVHTIRLTAVLRRPYKLHYETSQSGVFLSKIAENLLRVHFKSRVHLTNILFMVMRNLHLYPSTVHDTIRLELAQE